jgi:hypothetical protein
MIEMIEHSKYDEQRNVLVDHDDYDVQMDVLQVHLAHHEVGWDDHHEMVQVVVVGVGDDLHQQLQALVVV